MKRSGTSIITEILIVLSIILIFITGPLIPLILLLVVIGLAYKGKVKWILIALIILITGISTQLMDLELVFTTLALVEYLILLIGIIVYEVVRKFIKKEPQTINE